MEIAILKNALAYAEAIIDAIREPLVVLHPDLRIRTASHAFYETFRVTPEQSEGKLIYQLGNGQWNIPQLKVLLEEILVTKTSFNDFEVKHNFQNIGQKIMLLNARKLIMEGEKDPMILLAIEDITVKKNYDEQVEKEKNILAEIQHLKDISHQKDDFISMASHELKTPITSIRAFAQLLEQDFVLEGNAEAAQMLSRMNAQTIKLTSLIGDLLDVTKIEGGKLQYHFCYFDFNELIYDVIREIQLTTNVHTISATLIKTFSFYGDRDRIGQVITNLLSNAIKYSPHTNEIQVKSTKDKQFVSVFVKDFGVGISKEKQAKVFDRYFRVSGLKEDTYPGLGLGLYISSEIIKRHHGSISVKSTKGNGATFSFKLPVYKILIEEPLKK